MGRPPIAAEPDPRTRAPEQAPGSESGLRSVAPPHCCCSGHLLMLQNRAGTVRCRL